MTLDELVAKMRPFHNHICIAHDMKLCRLVGIGEDDMDYYYIVQTLDTPMHKHQWYSAVGACESIKGSYARYDIVESMFTINGHEATQNFLVIPHEKKLASKT